MARHPQRADNEILVHTFYFLTSSRGKHNEAPSQILSAGLEFGDQMEVNTVVPLMQLKAN